MFDKQFLILYSICLFVFTLFKKSVEGHKVQGAVVQNILYAFFYLLFFFKKKKTSYFAESKGEEMNMIKKTEKRKKKKNQSDSVRLLSLSLNSLMSC